MPPHTFSRRTTSTATTITVNSTATALSAAAAAVASNSFDNPTGSGFIGNGSTATTNHPVTGISVNPFLSGGETNPGTDYVLGWSGKGWYDPQNKWVGFLGTAAGSNNYDNNPLYGGWGGALENCYTRYEETGLKANTWWAPHRAELPPNFPSISQRGWVHQYDSNCIDVVGRKVYRKDGAKQEGERMVVYDLDTDAQLNAILMPSGMSYSYWYGGMECIPTRKSAGALWYLGWTGSNLLQLWEYDIAQGTWEILKTAAQLGNQASATLFTAPVISYNPRSNSVMIGNESDAKIIDCATEVMTTVAVPPSGSICINHQGAHNSGFCRDPVGNGWLQFSSRMSAVYRWNGSAWENRKAMPTYFNGSVRNQLVVPIDQYGVVWMIDYGGSGVPQGWLYRP